MKLKDITIPPEFRQMLDDFKSTPYYIWGMETFEHECKDPKKYSHLHEQYEHTLLNNTYGSIWMQLWANPTFAFEQIKNIPDDPKFGEMSKNVFLLTLLCIEALEERMYSADDNTFPRDLLLNYVSKLDPMTSNEWQGKMATLWNMLMDNDIFIKFIKSGQNVETFNHNMVAKVVWIMTNRNIYIGTQEELSRALEDNDIKLAKAVRSAMSKPCSNYIYNTVKYCISEC